MPHELPGGADDPALLRRLDQVLDPELDEPITELGFVRAIELRGDHATVSLRLPTSWCAVNFAYMMAEDVRRALLAADGIRQVTVLLGDHCAAGEIETAVNSGMPFGQAFSGEGPGDHLAALRLTFQRKGFLARQFRLLKSLRLAGWSFSAIAAFRLGEIVTTGEDLAIQTKGTAAVAYGAAEALRRYVERRAELGIDCGPLAPLMVNSDGASLTPQLLEDHYRVARTARLSLEANGSFCRAVLAARDADARDKNETKGGMHVPA